MPIEYKIANHNCNVVRRLIAPVMPELTLFFIVHGENERAKQFSKQTHFIREHPCGNAVIDYISNSPEILQKNRSFFCGLARTKTPGFLGFFKSEASIALCFMNQDRFESEEYFKNHALHLAWHAYALHRDIGKEDVSLYEFSDPHDKNSFILPSLEMEEIRHRNLLADIFSASLQYIQGKNTVLDLITRQRLGETINKEVGFISENFPFVVALDTLDHALKSEKNEKEKRKGNSVQHAIDLTTSIAQTYSVQSITQWSGFSYPAQHMAWCGFEPETILGTAIYTNENTYVHSIADTVAERLDIKPQMISNFQDFNPFTEFEANQRLHKKLAESTFEHIINKIRNPGEYMILLDEARAQNQKLLQGNPIGWCGHSVIMVAQALEAGETESFDDAVLSRIRELFNEEQLIIDFQIIWNFAHKIFETLREGGKADEATFKNIKECCPEFSSVINALHYIDERNEQIEEAKKQQKTGISSFISSNAIKS